MFGHGLSKGVDIDDNNYVDFAVGSPNNDTVYIYKTYPVVQIIATTKAINTTIQTNEKKFQIEVCFRYESPFPIKFNVSLNAFVGMNDSRNIFTFKINDKCNHTNCTFNVNLSANSKKICNLFEIDWIILPINVDIGLTYEVINGMPKYNNESNKVQGIYQKSKLCLYLNNKISNFTLFLILYRIL